jgi:hypothetical protein
VKAERPSNLINHLSANLSLFKPSRSLKNPLKTPRLQKVGTKWGHLHTYPKQDLMGFPENPLENLAVIRITSLCKERELFSVVKGNPSAQFVLPSKTMPVPLIPAGLNDPRKLLLSIDSTRARSFRSLSK